MGKSKSETGVCAVAGVERTCVYHFEDVHFILVSQYGLFYNTLETVGGTVEERIKLSEKLVQILKTN